MFNFLKGKKIFILAFALAVMIPGVVFGAFGDDVLVVGDPVTENVSEKFTGIYELSDTPGKYVKKGNNSVALVNLSGTFSITQAGTTYYENSSFEGDYTGTSTESGETLNVHEYSASDGIVFGSSADDNITANITDQLADLGTIQIIAVILAIPFLFYVLGRVRDLFPGE